MNVNLYSVIMFTTFQREGFVKKSIAAGLLLLMYVLAACSKPIQPTPTAIPILTFTVIPTLARTNTLPPTETSDGAPEGQPASEWNGIPIMPEAIAGEGDEESYVFTIKATPQQVQEYYQLELGKLGWHPFATGDGDSSLVFINNTSETLTISTIAKGDEVLVLLVKM
jgi:hypothetical protein